MSQTEKYTYAFESFNRAIQFRKVVEHFYKDVSLHFVAERNDYGFAKVIITDNGGYSENQASINELAQKFKGKYLEE